MDLNIKVLRDASAALDKMVDALIKLGSAFGSAANKGFKFFNQQQAKASIKRLTDLSTEITFLTRAQLATFAPDMENYAKNPTEANWEVVRHGIHHTLTLCKGLLNQVKANRDNIATKNFFPDLIGLIMERDRTLHEIRDAPRPTTPEALKVFREHCKKYSSLIKHLEATNGALTTFIEGLKAQLENASPPPAARPSGGRRKLQAV